MSVIFYVHNVIKIWQMCHIQLCIYNSEIVSHLIFRNYRVHYRGLIGLLVNKQYEFAKTRRLKMNGYFISKL